MADDDDISFSVLFCDLMRVNITVIEMIKIIFIEKFIFIFENFRQIFLIDRSTGNFHRHINAVRFPVHLQYKTIDVL